MKEPTKRKRTDDLLSDKTFEPLVSKICERVKEYNVYMGSSKIMFATEGWFNTYYQKDYQKNIDSVKFQMRLVAKSKEPQLL